MSSRRFRSAPNIGTDSLTNFRHRIPLELQIEHNVNESNPFNLNDITVGNHEKGDIRHYTGRCGDNLTGRSRVEPHGSREDLSRRTGRLVHRLSTYLSEEFPRSNTTDFRSTVNNVLGPQNKQRRMSSQLNHAGHICKAFLFLAYIVLLLGITIRETTQSQRLNVLSYFTVALGSYLFSIIIMLFLIEIMLFRKRFFYGLMSLFQRMVDHLVVGCMYFQRLLYRGKKKAWWGKQQRSALGGHETGYDIYCAEIPVEIRKKKPRRRHPSVLGAINHLKHVFSPEGCRSFYRVFAVRLLIGLYFGFMMIFFLITRHVRTVICRVVVGGVEILVLRRIVVPMVFYIGSKERDRERGTKNTRRITENKRNGLYKGASAHNPKPINENPYYFCYPYSADYGKCNDAYSTFDREKMAGDSHVRVFRRKSDTYAVKVELTRNHTDRRDVNLSGFRTFDPYNLAQQHLFLSRRMESSSTQKHLDSSILQYTQNIKVVNVIMQRTLVNEVSASVELSSKITEANPEETFQIALMLRNLAWCGLYVWATTLITRNSSKEPWDTSAMPSIFWYVEESFMWMITWDHIIELLAAPDIMRFIFSLSSLIDLTTMPIAKAITRFVSRDSAVQYSIHFGSLRILRLVRVESILYQVMPWISQAKLRLISLVIGAFVITLMFACAMYILEAPYITEGTQYRTLHDFLFFSLVTIATVGYGDFSPRKPLSRTIVMIAIVVTLTFLPTQVQKLITAFQTLLCSLRLSVMRLMNFLFQLFLILPTLSFFVCDVYVVNCIIHGVLGGKHSIQNENRGGSLLRGAMVLWGRITEKLIGRIPTKNQDYIVISGPIHPRQLMSMCREFSLSLHGAVTSILVVTPEPVAGYKQVIRSAFLRGSISVSVLQESIVSLQIQTYYRAARAIFIIGNVIPKESSRSCLYPKRQPNTLLLKDDYNTLLRFQGAHRVCWPNIPICLQLNDITIDRLLRKMGAYNVLCLQHFKMKLMAKTCANCPGFNTLITNLFASPPKYGDVMPDLSTDSQGTCVDNETMRLYLRGAKRQIYRLEFPECFYGIPYTVLARYLLQNKIYFLGVCFFPQRYWLNPVGYCVGDELNSKLTNIPFAGIVLAKSLSVVQQVAEMRTLHVSKELIVMEKLLMQKCKRSLLDSVVFVVGIIPKDAES